MNRAQFVAGCVLAILAFAPAACVGTKQSAAAKDAAPAATMAEPKGVQVAQAGDPNDPIICKGEADSTTRTRKHKRCLKKSEWEAKSKEAQDVFDDMRNGTINPCATDGSCPTAIAPHPF